MLQRLTGDELMAHVARNCLSNTVRTSECLSTRSGRGNVLVHGQDEGCLLYTSDAADES